MLRMEATMRTHAYEQRANGGEGNKHRLNRYVQNIVKNGMWIKEQWVWVDTKTPCHRGKIFKRVLLGIGCCIDS